MPPNADWQYTKIGILVKHGSAWSGKFLPPQSHGGRSFKTDDRPARLRRSCLDMRDVFAGARLIPRRAKRRELWKRLAPARRGGDAAPRNASRRARRKARHANAILKTIRRRSRGRRTNPFASRDVIEQNCSQRRPSSPFHRDGNSGGGGSVLIRPRWIAIRNKELADSIPTASRSR